MFRGRWRFSIILVLALGVLLLQATSAGAVARPSPVVRAPKSSPNTELYWNGDLGPGEYGVNGFLPDEGNDFNAATDPYPPSDPETGFSPTQEYFAGIIHGQPTDGSPVVGLYCIDIRTDTFPGFGYGLGSWDEANVPNVGYVARLLSDYYPNTDEPAGLTDDQKAAAVQEAIWFFSDGFVLSTSDPLHGTVVDIVNDVKSKGPLSEPPPPSLTIAPSSASGASGGVLGPFTVTTDHPPAILNAAGGNMYSNRAGTAQIPEGSSVPSGEKVWLRATQGASTVVLDATSKAIVPTGNVYLYDGKTAGYTEAQKLILATTATLTSTVSATAEFKPSGSLVVKKTVLGPGARSQGRVVIRVVCDDGVRRLPFVIPAGAHVGTRSRTYRHIVAGTTCTVTETVNGSVVGTEVVVVGNGQQATIRSGKSVTVRIIDFYYRVGSLLVRKTIAGPAAGQQGEVRIHSVCNGKALTPDFVIPAGTAAGSQTKQYDGLRLPAKCKVTETVDGHTSTVSVDVEGSGQTVSVPAGGIAEADISDTYGLVPGQLEVTKTIAGPLAGQQGTVVIHSVCNGTALSPDFVIPAGTPAGDQSYTYSSVPTPASCVVTETTDGHTSAVSVAVVGSPHTATIAPGGSGAAQITDTYGAVPGSLLVTKTISGPLAGHQGPVTIQVTCNGAALSPDFVIPAGTRAGSVSHSFDGIPADSVCTVNETADGATATVTATVSGTGQAVTIPAGNVVPVNVTDVYQDTPGSLRVTKRITGPAAGKQGRIAILVACGGPLNDFAFVIPAHSRAGSVSRDFDGLPAGSRCIVTEAVDGHTGTVAVAVSRRSQLVTIRANRTVTARVSDTYYVHKTPPHGRG